MTLDDARAAHPAFGFAAYAFEPGGPVTLEIHDQGEIFTFVGPTLEDALKRAFPPTEAPPTEPTDPALGLFA